MFTIDRPAFCGGGAGGGWPFFRPNPSGAWGGQGQFGPFDFKIWSHPGRCGGGSFGAPFGFGCCPGAPSTGGANGCCPGAPSTGAGNGCCPPEQQKVKILLI